MRQMHLPATLTVQAVNSSFADSFCALKEQKEGKIVPTANNFVDVWVWILFSFCAYSAPVSLCTFTQSVALGCIPVGASPRPCSNINSQNYLQLRPVLARNIYCTISWAVFLLGLRPALARNICCTQYPVIYTCWGFAPFLFKCKLSKLFAASPCLCS